MRVKLHLFHGSDIIFFVKRFGLYDETGGMKYDGGQKMSVLRRSQQSFIFERNGRAVHLLQMRKSGGNKSAGSYGGAEDWETVRKCLM